MLLVFHATDCQRPQTNLKKDIHHQPFEYVILDNIQGVETTFHHGDNVITLNSSALEKKGNSNKPARRKQNIFFIPKDKKINLNETCINRN